MLIEKHTDYTIEELEAWEKAFANGELKGKRWGTRRGDKTYHIPWSKLKINHIKNIIIWVKDRPDVYGGPSGDKLIRDMQELLKMKMQEETAAGKLLYGVDV